MVYRASTGNEGVNGSLWVSLTLLHSICELWSRKLARIGLAILGG